MYNRAVFVYDVRDRRLVDAVRGRPPAGGPGRFIAWLLACLVSVGILGLDNELRARLFADVTMLSALFCGLLAAIPAVGIYRLVRRRQGRDIFLDKDGTDE